MRMISNARPCAKSSSRLDECQLPFLFRKPTNVDQPRSLGRRAVRRLEKIPIEAAVHDVDFGPITKFRPAPKLAATIR